ncbi:hypothetical protein [Methanosarcina sp. 1.H.T.1A.1]|uniref:hypothetical protein n=1 Tax=Methanosarcina sp. 1.H.T.1A.1 TaxID=1483602 RepID=UPI0012DFED79|nr:hypothetical protein [Methanosarcina sp. 1.H.T.1A.1]
MKVEELESAETILNWLININPSQNTRRSYLLSMQHYTGFLEKHQKNCCNRREIYEGRIVWETEGLDIYMHDFRRENGIKKAIKERKVARFKLEIR